MIIQARHVFKFMYLKRHSQVNQQARNFARSPFPNEVTHYLRRAELINSIRLHLHTSPPKLLASQLNTRLLDSFVVANALRSAPSADSALMFVDMLKEVSHFSHNQITICALAKVLVKSQRIDDLKALIRNINVGMCTNTRVCYMDLMRWHAAAGNLESFLRIWDEYRASNKRACTESYNIAMQLYAKKGKSSECMQIFRSMIDEGALPNSRTYTVMIEHLVSLGKLDAALDIFNMLPSMRIKRTSMQYSVLVKGFIGVERFDAVQAIVKEMQVDGILPGRAMHLSLQRMHEAGYIQETEEFIRAMVPDERIKNIAYFVDDSGEDEDEGKGNDNCIKGGSSGDAVRLKPWLDPGALASALNNWRPDEVAALEDANFVWTSRLVCKILRNFRSPESAWEFFCWVANRPGFTHDVYTVQRMITLLARHGHAELVDKLLWKVRREGIRLPFTTVRLIIDFYGLSKNADAAFEVFTNYKSLCGDISKSNLMLMYSSLLRTFIRCGRNSHALEVLDEMILRGIDPDVQTYCGVMHYFALEGDLKTVQRLLMMARQSGVEPDAFMFRVLICGYCKCERAGFAWRAFEDMRNNNLMPDAETKKLLVKSLWKDGMLREAAAVEENCEEIKDVLPRALPGHMWTVSSADMTRICTIYSDSLMPSETDEYDNREI